MTEVNDLGGSEQLHEPVSGPIDLGTLATQAVDRFAAVAETRHLLLTVHAAPSGAVISAPADLVDRLIGVLVDNACKYAPEGAVDVTVAADAGRVSLLVGDSGPGIPEAERDRVFDRFHRSVMTSSEADGAGLGLAIGDAIVRATAGRWSVGTAPAGSGLFTVSWSRASLGPRRQRSGWGRRRRPLPPAPRRSPRAGRGTADTAMTPRHQMPESAAISGPNAAC